jgi:hypothetical protein
MLLQNRQKTPSENLVVGQVISTRELSPLDRRGIGLVYRYVPEHILSFMHATINTHVDAPE